MARKRGVPDWVYYVVAVALSLATIPMYRYMFAHAADSRLPASPVIVHQQLAYTAPVVASGTALKPLLPGELCEAGYVVLKNGNAYTQGIGPDGHPARCVGGSVIVSRP